MALTVRLRGIHLKGATHMNRVVLAPPGATMATWRNR